MNVSSLGINSTQTRKKSPPPQLSKGWRYQDTKYGSVVFLYTVQALDINKQVTQPSDLKKAATTFEQTFKSALDLHAPVKVIQQRRLYNPQHHREHKNPNFKKEQSYGSSKVLW